MVRVDNIKAEMARINMKQADLSDFLGIAKSTVWMKLNCKIPFTVDELIKIAIHFDKTVEFFLNY